MSRQQQAQDSQTWEEHYRRQQQQNPNAPPGQQQYYQQQQQYPIGYGAPPPPQRQYSTNQLPPMYPSMPQSEFPSSHQMQQGPPSWAANPPPPLWNPAQPVNPPQAAPLATAPPPEKPFSESRTDATGKYRYSLVVEQQPQRARMCGFGDKDRRPITPPPCIRLIVTDVATGKPAQLEQSDGMFFVLQVNLWDQDATREVNIVKSSSTSPAISISTATTTSFPPPEPQRHMSYPMLQAPSGQYYYDPNAGMYPPGQHPQYSAQPPGYISNPLSNSNSMFTRNLIGSLTVNAAWLKDTNGVDGFFFVLQDLSVRTEGWFRLRMNFTDVKDPSGNGTNKTKARCLAWVFSEKFQVYSAKKFPGVIESTSLSKCFAQQGIKIPIRKDARNGEKDNDGDEDE